MNIASFITHFPLILAKMPEKKFNWRKMIKHTTKMMNEHGLLQKDIVAIEWESHINMDNETSGFYRNSSMEFSNRFQKALDGEPVFKPFFIYEYNETDGFTLIRNPIKDNSNE